VPNFDPREILSNIRRLIAGKDTKPMTPFYKNFRGKIEMLDGIRAITSGCVSTIDENTIEITELPVGVWTQAYKENVLEPCLHGEEKESKDSKTKNTAAADTVSKAVITDYREYHTDTTVRFVVKMTDAQYKHAEKVGFYKFFKLQKPLSLNSMVMFDHSGVLRRYETVDEILKEFYTVRVEMYVKRKAYMEGMLGAESLKLDNIARFIMEKIEGKIKVENMKKVDICKILKERKYDADPVAKWRARIVKEEGYQADNENENEENDAEADVDAKDKDKNNYDYLLGMPIWNLTMEKKDDILKQQKNKGDELKLLKSKTANDLWIEDLDIFLTELDKIEAKEKEEEKVSQLKAFKAGNAFKSSNAGGRSKTTKMSDGKLEYLPAEDGIFIEPKIEQELITKSAKEKEATQKLKIKNEIKKEVNIVDIIMDSKVNDEIDCKVLGDNEIASLIKNMDKPGNAAIKKEPKVAVKKEPKIKAENGSCEKPARKKAATSNDKSNKENIASYFNKPKKDAKQKNDDYSDYDDGDDDDDDIVSLASINESELASETSQKRRVVVRERKNKVKYRNDDDGDITCDEDDDDFLVDQTESDFSADLKDSPVSKPSKPTTKPKVAAKRVAAKSPTRSPSRSPSLPKASSIFSKKNKAIFSPKQEKRKVDKADSLDAFDSDDSAESKRKPTKTKKVLGEIQPPSKESNFFKKQTSKTSVKSTSKKVADDISIISDDSDDEFVASSKSKSKKTSAPIADFFKKGGSGRSAAVASKKKTAVLLSSDDEY
jgi:DNA topoisomerase II